MHLKHFSKGAVIRFTSLRTDEEMLRVERSPNGKIKRSGSTPLDDLQVEMDGSALDIRGLLYDAQGPVVRVKADGGQDSYADCAMEIALPGRKPTRTLIATDETAHRIIEQSRPTDE
jgi:hypothetical protein